MLRHGLRVSVAILTFAIGISLVWVLGLIPRLETALVDRFFAVDDLRIVSPGFVDPTEDANQVYSLLIRERFTFEETRLIVLKPVTTGYALWEDESTREQFGRTETFHQWLKESMPEAQSQTLDNYLEKNKTAEPLRVSNLGINYTMFGEIDFSPYDVGSFWTRFYRKYPFSSGLIMFSQVGFNEQHDQAFVYAGRGCGGLCGEGAYYLLRKTNGKWEILSEQGLWVS
jgi:hypothetical protein